jgi:phosphatidylglycerol:prolipoprotein diacylglycerol transferase
MHPILVDFGTHDIPWLGTTHLFLPAYGLIFAAGTLAAWWWFVARARAVIELPPEPVFNLAFYTLLAGLFGAKLTLILVDLPLLPRAPGGNSGNDPQRRRSDGRHPGGRAGVHLLRAGAGLPLLTLGDAIVAPVALAQGIGRLGCLAAGCCYGVATQGWCAITFTPCGRPRSNRRPLGVPLFPVQLVEFAFDVVLALVLTLAWRRG